jgi:hypothetical protein
MARGRSKSGNALLGIVVVIAVILWIIGRVLDSVGVVTPIVIFVLIIAGVVWYKHAQRQKRILYLLDKYGDEQIVNHILQQHFWQGQTAEQLRDSVGNPITVDNKAMATRKREIWKYNSIGKRRYALRITLDDDVVIGWDQKN